MPLSQEQRTIIEEEAKRRGVDPAKLIAAAERARAEDAKAGADAARAASSPDKATDKAATPAKAAAELRPLYQYHLAFVKVNEVREHWLGVPKWSVEEGGEENAAQFAARMLASPAKSDPSAP
jgi:hypothetical protein